MREKLLFVFLSAFACLLAGWWLGAQYGAIHATPPGPGVAVQAAVAPPPLVTPLSNQPVTVLLLVVDSLAASKPQLDGCWLLTFLPGTSQFFLVGFPLDTPVGTGYRLLDYFNAGRTLEDAVLFTLEGVRSAYGQGLPIQYQVRLDQALLAETVNRLGGVTIGGERLDGSALLQRYAALPPDAHRARADFQRDALQGLADALKRQPWTAETLDQWYPRYQAFSPDAEDLRQFALKALPYADNEIYLQIFEPPPAP